MTRELGSLGLAGALEVTRALAKVEPTTFMTRSQDARRSRDVPMPVPLPLGPAHPTSLTACWALFVLECRRSHGDRNREDKSCLTGQ